MSGGVSELGGMKMVKKEKPFFGFMVGLCLAILIVFSVGNALLLSEIKNNVANTFSSDFNSIVNNQQVLFNTQVALADNQKVIVNACGLQGMIQEGCVISNQTNIDANTSAVTLLCPIKEVQGE